jgi:hypothetical protein
VVDGVLYKLFGFMPERVENAGRAAAPYGHA